MLSHGQFAHVDRIGLRITRALMLLSSRKASAAVEDVVSSLGSVRRRLSEILSLLTEDEVNSEAFTGRPYTISDIVVHLQEYEIAAAQHVLSALAAPPHEGDDPTPAELKSLVLRHDEPVRPSGRHMAVNTLIDILDTARFGSLQRVFNEARVSELAARRTTLYGDVSVNLKAAIDTIWIHESSHTDQIQALSLAAHTS